MRAKEKKYLIITLALLTFFVIYTILVKYNDVDAIGPNQSSVGFKAFNLAIHNLFGVNFILYSITDWLSILPIAIGIIFGVIGLAQWIRRKRITKVDVNILALGLLYIITFLFYLLFEKIVINYRPVLINGILEVSYPSSTTMLVICFMGSFIDQVNKYFKNKLKKLVITISIIFTIFMVGGRLVSGVHWVTDIIGGVIISSCLIFFYLTIKEFLSRKLIKN